MLRVLLIGGCLLLPALSFGANAPATKEINIDDGETISAREGGPDGTRIDSREEATFDKLIRVRKDFKDKVLASVSEL